MLKLIFVLLSLFGSYTAFAADEAKPTEPAYDDFCYDADKVYKRCQDQNEIYLKAFDEALKQNKQVLIVYGHESCSWCNAIIKAVYFSQYAPELQSRYVIVPIANSSVFLSGKNLMALLRKKYNQNDASGVPYLFVIDPKSQKGSLIDLLPYERNTEETENAPSYSGYHVENILIDLYKISDSIKSTEQKP